MHLWSPILELSFLGILPELFLFLSISTLLVFGSFFNNQILKDGSIVFLCRQFSQISIFILLVTLCLVIFAPFEHQSLFHNSLICNPLTQFRKCFILLTTCFVIFISLSFIKREQINAFEYIILILFSTLGMMLLVRSQDLIVLYLSIEIQSLALYALAAFKRDSAFSTEAGLKYFILGSFSSGLLLFGSSLLYGFTGRTNLEEIAIFFYGLEQISPGVSLGLLCFLTALLFKISAAPFHAWSPDVYEGSISSVTSFFSILPKFTIVILCRRLLFFSFFELFDIWQPILLFSRLLSIVVAAFSALYQRKLKRFLAYSSIGHVGYLLLGLRTGTIEGLQRVLIYLIIYLITSLCVWSFILSIRFQKTNKTLLYIRELNGLGKTNPLLAFTLAIIIFSIAGTPPLAGFLAKILVLFSAIESSLYSLAIVGVITSVLSAFYYLRFIKIIYFDFVQKTSSLFTIDKEKSYLIGFSLLFIVFLFLYPSPLITCLHYFSLWFIL